jgi:integrase
VIQRHISRLGRIEEAGAAYVVTELGLRIGTEPRYARAHWRRFLILEVGTAAREGALRELKWEQLDMRLRRIRLNPEGRRQTKKRRPTIAMAPTLAAEIASWVRDSEYVISYYGEQLTTRSFFSHLADSAGVSGSAKVLRHTVRTYLAEHGRRRSE